MKYLLLLLLTIPFASFSQALPMEDGKVVYEQIDSVAGSQTELYTKAKAWIINSFNGKKQKFQVDNENSGQMTSSGDTHFDFLVGHNGYPVVGVCYFYIQVTCKENKTHIMFYNIRAKVGYNNPEPIEGFSQRGPVIDADRKAIKEGVYRSVNSLMLSNMANFKNAMASKTHATF